MCVCFSEIHPKRKCNERTLNESDESKINAALHTKKESIVTEEYTCNECSDTMREYFCSLSPGIWAMPMRCEMKVEEEEEGDAEEEIRR